MSSILSNPKQKLNTFHIHSQTNREINVNLNKISEDFDLNFNPKDLESHFKSLSKNEFIYIQSKFPNFSDNGNYNKIRSYFFHASFQKKNSNISIFV